jgi:MFS family permease
MPMSNSPVLTRQEATASRMSGAKSHGISKMAWHVLLASWLGETFDGMDASIYALVLFPALAELLQTSSHSVVGVYGSVVLAVFMLGWAVGASAFGILSDYIGRARTMMLTILVYALFTGLCATAHNWCELAIYRFFVGCGIGGEICLGPIMISEYWKGRSRLHALAALNSSFGVGFLLAALLNLGLGSLGWRWLFVAGVAPAFITLYIRATLKEPEQFTAVQSLKQKLRKKPRQLLTDAERKLLRFTFPVLFSAENRSKVLVVIGLASSAIIGYWAVLSWIPAWINQLTGTQAVLERSQAAIVMNLGAITACALSGFLLTRISISNAFRISFAAALICYLGMFLTVHSFSPALLCWVFFVGAFASTPFVFLFVYTPELFSADIRGTAFGFSVQVGRVFAGLAALAGGQIIQFCNGSYATAGATIALCYLVGLAATCFMPRTEGEVELGVSHELLTQPA